MWKRFNVDRAERLRLKPGSRTVGSEIRYILATDVDCQTSLHLDAASTGVHKCGGEDVLLTLIVMSYQLLSVCSVSLTVSVLTAVETWRWYDHHIGRQHPPTLGSVIFDNENKYETGKNEEETYSLTKAETDRKNIENT